MRGCRKKARADPGIADALKRLSIFGGLELQARIFELDDLCLRKGVEKTERQHLEQTGIIVVRKIAARMPSGYLACVSCWYYVHY